jgi:hypothetical protein
VAALDEIIPAVVRRIEKARAKVRAHVWSQLPGGVPASRLADRDLRDSMVLDVDATLVTVHSEKEGAAVTFKKGFGYHPLGVWCENTQESSRCCCGTATPVPTPQPTTSPS